MMESMSLERLVECPICFEKLDGLNRMLPCQHTFCKQCLKQVIEKSYELRCPECRALHTESIDDLQPNILVMKVLEYIELRRKEAQNLKCDKTTSTDEKKVSSPFIFKFQGITTASESQHNKMDVISVGPCRRNFQKGRYFSFREKTAISSTQAVLRPINRTSASPQTSSSASTEVEETLDCFYRKTRDKMRLHGSCKQKPNVENIGSNVTSSGQKPSPFRFEGHSSNSPKSHVDSHGSEVSIRRVFPVEVVNNSSSFSSKPEGKIVPSSGQKDGTLERTLNLSKNAPSLNASSRLLNVSSLTIGKGLSGKSRIGQNVFSPIALSSGSSTYGSEVSIRRVFPVELVNNSSSFSSKPEGKIVASSGQKDGTLERTLNLSKNAPSLNASSRLLNVSSLTIGKGLSGESRIGQNVFSPIALSSGSSMELVNGKLKSTPFGTDKNASTSSAPSKPSNDGFNRNCLTNENNAQSSTWNFATSSSNGKDKNIFTFQAVAQPKILARKYNFRCRSKEVSQNISKIAQTGAQSFDLPLPSNSQGSASGAGKPFDPKSYFFDVKLK